jgi:hypothetical protein
MRKPNSKPVKAAKSKPVRIGANRQMQIAEKRAKMPSLVKSAALRFAKIAACLAIAGGVAYGALTYGPGVSGKISGAVKSSGRLPSDIKVTGCSLPVQALLMRAIDSMTRADSSSFCRAGIMMAAATISEIENVGVKRIGGQTTLITVKERKPVAMIHNGGIFLVDKNGVCFSTVPGKFYELPLIAFGRVAPGDTVDLELFNRIKTAARGLGGAFFRDISEIDLSGGSEVNLIFRSSDTEYKVASRDVENRLVHVKALKERLTQESAKPMRIDLRYRNYAFVTTR